MVGVSIADGGAVADGSGDDRDGDAVAVAAAAGNRLWVGGEWWFERWWLW